MTTEMMFLTGSFVTACCADDADDYLFKVGMMIATLRLEVHYIRLIRVEQSGHGVNFTP